ncbi:MAG: DEAD/DEAH box helicase [Lentisphaeria bacterium]|nr:DEAD/DEAH box helicase [Lentisphaeria bacterium]
MKSAKANAKVSKDAMDESTLGEERAHSILSKKKLGEWEVPSVENPQEGEVYFQNFPLEKAILRAALEDLGFRKCTPIQALALPVAITGADVAGKAQTGTGKTAVFLMSMLNQFIQNKDERRLNQPFALVLAPTRELAIQIAKDADNLSVYTSLRTVAVFGGMDYERQRRLLQAGCDLIVATPGRLIDFLQKRVIDTSLLKVLIIDEADRMLDMGFIPDVKRIINYLPPKEERQTMLFSATLLQYIMNLVSRWLRPDPMVLEVEPEKVVAEGVNETVYACSTQEKLSIIMWILQHEDVHRALIFRNRRRDVEELHSELQKYGIECEMLSGDVSQNRRLNILEAFRNGTTKVVVATDVAGRGIQVDDITHVFNYDLPYEAEDYVHRVGRTARAGHQGRAVSFADEDNAFVMPEIEEYIGRALPTEQPPEEMLVLPAMVCNPRRSVSDKHEASGRNEGGFHGHRGGFSHSRGSFGGSSSNSGGFSRSRSSFHRTGTTHR